MVVVCLRGGICQKKNAEMCCRSKKCDASKSEQFMSTAQRSAWCERNDVQILALADA